MTCPIESNPNLHSDLVHDPLPHQCHTTAAVCCVSPAVSFCLSASPCCLSAVFWKLKITRVGALGWCIRITATGIKEIIPSSSTYDSLTGLIQKQTRKFESSQEDVHRYAQNLSMENFHRIFMFSLKTSIHFIEAPIFYIFRLRIYRLLLIGSSRLINFHIVL
jgi:hypothetical protein